MGGEVERRVARVLPRLRTAIAEGAWDEARQLWREALERGAAWRSYRESRPGLAELKVEEALPLARDLVAVQDAARMAGDFRPAAEAAAEAVEIRRRFVGASAGGRADLAAALGAASRNLAALEHFEEALALSEEALAIERELQEGSALDRRAALVSTLLNLEFLLGKAEQGARAVEVAREAVGLRREMESEQPGLAGGVVFALMTLRERLESEGRTEEAKAVAREMVARARGLRKKGPADRQGP